MIAMTPVTGLDLTGFTEREPGVWADERFKVLPPFGTPARGA
ncbi:hypothetical protein [Streptomyces sp. NPDC059862]